MNIVYTGMEWFMVYGNVLLAHLGLALLIVGSMILLKFDGAIPIIKLNLVFASPGLNIFIGGTIIIVTFFGWYGAIRKKRWMIITFASLLTMILSIEMGFALFAILRLKNNEEATEEFWQNMFEKYRTYPLVDEFINFLQTALICCGGWGARDYPNTHNSTIDTVPWSCCVKDLDVTPKFDDLYYVSCSSGWTYPPGCIDEINRFLNWSYTNFNYISIGIVIFEIIGILYTLCYLRIMRNVEQRDYDRMPKYDEAEELGQEDPKKEYSSTFDPKILTKNQNSSIFNPKIFTKKQNYETF